MPMRLLAKAFAAAHIALPDDMMGSEEDTGGCVEAKVDCPHTMADHKAGHLQFPSADQATDILLAGCEVGDCGSTDENWYCHGCGIVACARYVHRHMVVHAACADHPLATSLTDLHTWCYSCASYVVSDCLTVGKVAFKKVREAETQHTTGKDQAGSTTNKGGDLVVEGEKEQVSEGGKIGKRDEDEEHAEEAEPSGEGSSIKNTRGLADIAAGIRAGKIKNIICMTGAGLSVSAGIPDFRTPGSGLYDNLQKYNLPMPEAIFTLSYFRKDPQPFVTLAKELYPGEYDPTPAHFFIKLLHDKGVLLRCFSQNIDGLETLAGLPKDKLVQAHGGFSAAHCIDCNAEHPVEKCKESFMQEEVPRCSSCNGYVKPDIVFFGEALPVSFAERVKADFPKCDLLVVLGTSLQVQPFASLISSPPKDSPRLLVNRELAGVWKEESILTRLARKWGISKDEAARLLDSGMNMHPELAGKDVSAEIHSGFEFENEEKYDTFFKGDCDVGVRVLLDLIGDGWRKDLEHLVESYPSKSAL